MKDYSRVLWEEAYSTKEKICVNLSNLFVCLSLSGIQVNCHWWTMDESLSSRRGHVSVLSSFPPSVGREITVAVVKPLGASLGNPDNHSMLHTDRQVCVHACVLPVWKVKHTLSC